MHLVLRKARVSGIPDILCQFLLMFFGGCAGSTGGAMKQIRILLVIKLVKREFKKILHPRAMIPLKMNGKAVPSDVVANISSFFILYIVIFPFLLHLCANDTSNLLAHYGVRFKDPYGNYYHYNCSPGPCGFGARSRGSRCSEPAVSGAATAAGSHAVERSGRRAGL